MLRICSGKATAVVFGLAMLAAGPAARAAVVPLPIGSFGAPIVTFSEPAIGTAISGLTVNGLTFSETFATTIVATGGPGATNNIAQPAALGTSNPIGQTTTVQLAQPATAFGFGFALLTGQDLGDAVRIELFDGATSLGVLSFAGAPDPTFTGGFAGIGSDVPFDSVKFSFSFTAPQYDFDNIRVNFVDVPIAGTLPLVLLTLGALAPTLRRRSSQG